MIPDFSKYSDGLVPAIIQDKKTKRVLMLGYMNKEAYEETLKLQQVVFYSRSKKRLWKKGETSGNFLNLKSMTLDCDQDCLLLKVQPVGPVCHTGADTCFNEENKKGGFMNELEDVIDDRMRNPNVNSYVSKLYQKGVNKIAQKVGEEAVELVIEAMDNNDDLFKDEAADLLFHYLILLQTRGMRLSDIKGELKKRHKK
jgi:phosphoribosyl-AMP cyclohydrolase / phosphoribosyl-ATP pyrophosphohydrolase